MKMSRESKIFTKTFLSRWQLVTNLTSRILATKLTKTFLSRSEARN